MVSVVRQQQLRDRTIDVHPSVTIDAQPNAPSEVAFVDGLARLEVRIARLEALVTQLSREALRNAVTDATVTHNASPVTPVTPDRNAVTEAEAVTPRNAYRNAERQRRYRERKKQHGAADTQR